MAASEAIPARRRRFERGEPKYSLTPNKARLLADIAEFGMLTTSQCARIAGISQKSAYNWLRDLFDGELTQRIAVPYVALPPDNRNDASLAFGPGETIHIASRDGLKYLLDGGYISSGVIARKPLAYGPRNFRLLRHAILVRDVRIWLELQLRQHLDHELEAWKDEEEAHLAVARPDAWFTYRINAQRVFTRFVEADRGTERGEKRWAEKIGDYSRLLSGDTVKSLTGYNTARVMTVTLDAARRDQLANLVARLIVGTALSPNDFLFASRLDLETTVLTDSVWRIPGEAALIPLVPAAYLD